MTSDPWTRWAPCFTDQLRLTFRLALARSDTRAAATDKTISAKGALSAWFIPHGRAMINAVTRLAEWKCVSLFDAREGSNEG